MMIKKFVAAALLGLLSVASQAQTVPGKIQLTWTLPTLTTDGLPLTGANALTEMRVYLSTSPIPDNSTMPATVVLGGAVTTTDYTMTVPNGASIYARVKACNRPSAATECSAFSGQVFKVVQASTVPQIPTALGIEIVITP